MKRYFQNEKIEAGTDEAGRGCLSGPVVAASVVVSDDFEHPLINDSKKMSEKQRNQLRLYIEKNAINYAVGIVSEKEIDKINILNASFLAMHRSLEGIEGNFEYIIVDGNQFKPYKSYPFKTLVKGDSRFVSIAAASILAKTYRDKIMDELHLEFPVYNWKKNKGYPTKEHRRAIASIGICKYHRTSFKLLPNHMSVKL